MKPQLPQPNTCDLISPDLKESSFHRSPVAFFQAVVSLYLQSGGAARLRRPPGVDLREALGGVTWRPFLQRSGRDKSGQRRRRRSLTWRIQWVSNGDLSAV